MEEYVSSEPSPSVIRYKTSCWN